MHNNAHGLVRMTPRKQRSTETKLRSFMGGLIPRIRKPERSARFGEDSFRSRRFGALGPGKPPNTQWMSRSRSDQPLLAIHGALLARGRVQKRLSRLRLPVGSLPLSSGQLTLNCASIVSRRRREFGKALTQK